MTQYRFINFGLTSLHQDGVHRVFFFWEDRQIFHSYAEKSEAHRDDHQSYGKLRPLGQVVVPNIRLEARQADVKAIGDEPQHCEDRSQVQPLRRKTNLPETKHRNWNYEGQN